MDRAVPLLARARRPSQGEIDTLYREEALRQWILREHGRPVPIPVGSVSISFPLFSRGPSRQQRLRDSIVHHDNLLRFERLAARLRSQRDSARRVDSLAAASRTVVQ